jgi:hypothetical protein
VRRCLAKDLPLKLKLTQIPKNYKTPFPPLYKDLQQVDVLKKNMVENPAYLDQVGNK